MFGFPFITSLIVVITGVIVVSLLVNKGLAKRSSEKGATINATDEAHTSK
tara:strand:- start:70397 stop:70546 length:150 start_codon:yes stop_codon:yes gene_type:complete